MTPWRSGAKRAFPAGSRSGELCLALVDTMAQRRDDRYRVSKPPPDFADYGDLLAWCPRMGAVASHDAEGLRPLPAESPEAAAAVFRPAMELRAAVARIFNACARRTSRRRMTWPAKSSENRGTYSCAGPDS